MKKLMRVETNASTMFITYDDETKIVMCLDNEDTNGGFPLKDVEDDSSWEQFDDVEDIEEWLGDAEIVEEIYLSEWYAVEMDDDDNDWGTGSYNWYEAVSMARKRGAKKIAVIDGNECVEELYEGKDF